MASDLKIIPVYDIFMKYNYIVPIYQRNYAWEEKQIDQLIEDIDGAIGHGKENYFLGNLIVNQTDNNLYEVIDGQQRLTTLYLLERFLGLPFAKEALKFEAREKYARTLAIVSESGDNDLLEELTAKEITKGFQIINDYFNNKQFDKTEFAKKLKKVFLIRVQVPQNIDLNHYFEIMNTRGEQLELHEIAKAKILEVLSNDDEKKAAAEIWEKCSDMNSYVQMNFDASVRMNLFTNDWTSLKNELQGFDAVKEKITGDGGNSDKKTLQDILVENKLLNLNDPSKGTDMENERFESTVSFPNFLLQVSAVVRELGEEDSSLDDKNFLDNLSWAWSTTEKAKEFLYYLLKCRVLFDKYILKREFARDYKEIGKWSLQRLEKYTDKKGSKPKYVGTFGDEDSINKQLRTLQSALRITYTSPKTMHWITFLLAELLNNESVNLICLLEGYCKKKVIASDYRNQSDFGIERIVFSYLDYLLYRDGYSFDGKEIISPLRDDWQFQFRSSIEHFYPQHPDATEVWDSEDLNCFGNLALITVSGNSKFSNMPPEGKIKYDYIVSQSLKLKIMKAMTNGDTWTKIKAKKHQQEMFRILKK
ncbi:DUF262 domain-containing HNH endonuclease family protein [Sporosarcina jeotgali]|uniref:DUF262 domain-containing HNH endonuclease family protein n=1 Tax=Sporosarcina jeotgali TaxID=3020056 RepID=A0ABZ0KVJ8_9BACL|nr:DUF262 domain-containing HNH endonuclease family protein [Sporosarcina sp. B2O-1]WOV83898.1 DUF262 domain-containing HNH endonuclease family protein [Sporosarcina sp. B2O-1]